MGFGGFLFVCLFLFPLPVCHKPAHPFGYTNHPVSPWTTLVSQKRVSLFPGQQQPTWQSFSYSMQGWFIPHSCPLLSLTPRWGFRQTSDRFQLALSIQVLLCCWKIFSLLFMACVKKASSTPSRYIPQRLYCPSRQGKHFYSYCGSMSLRKSRGLYSRPYESL